MQVWPRKRSWFQLSIAVLIATLVALLVLHRPDRLPGWLALAGPLIGAAWYWLAMRRFLRRRHLKRLPFPESWQQELETCVPFYGQLDEAGRRRFEADIRFFLAEQHIYGPRGAPVDEETKVLIAASAAMLGFGLPAWEWPQLRDIIVYPTAFAEGSYQTGDKENILGMVHHQGPIIFSARDLKHGFCNPQDGLNVGLHELAHVMDLQDGEADGIPAGVSFVSTAPWVNVIAETLKEVRHPRRRQVLRRYAGTNEAELFAVAVEVFFERPQRLKKDDPEMYELLAHFFNQDPAGGS